MHMLWADWLVRIAGCYLAFGLAFALPFLTIGVNKIDAAARGAGWGFRLIIIPGTIALWPLLLWRWLAGAKTPPEENNPHRAAARQRSAPAGKEAAP
ncbi:MAG: hypothetical protein ONB48_10410 [candidate division KSB1 bacterium]|nr:hypothetical protein [candidate division KSB1 bacterium]MDZ7273901.1 hypothetical protein [candidate division KSB1 bacterium]MDZ7286057.1 hypothetical protein [candidate division KSB1 bacterium]MDZ7299089.1 hypothetical protein [candidate division KSB1 bacterium]MDZ7306392.1 hypothetical protein [candidate division KSB1 bacterium]